MSIRLTKKMLDAMYSALNSALAGEGWDGGDFAGMDPRQFERAVEWIRQELKRRSRSAGGADHG